MGKREDYRRLARYTDGIRDSLRFLKWERSHYDYVLTACHPMVPQLPRSISSSALVSPTGIVRHVESFKEGDSCKLSVDCRIEVNRSSFCISRVCRAQMGIGGDSYTDLRMRGPTLLLYRV